MVTPNIGVNLDFSSGPKRNDPITGFKFLVLASGITAQFTNVTGLSEESEVINYREGADPVRYRKYPGITTYQNVSCQHGITRGLDLLEWRRLVAHYDSGPQADGVPPPSYRREVVVHIYEKGTTTPARSWFIHQAWPATLAANDLNAQASEIEIERMDLAHEGITWA